MTLFCPECGTEKGPFVKNSLCLNCFLKKNKILNVPEKIEISFCPSCTKILVHGKWVKQSEKILKDFIIKKIKTKELTNQKFDVELIQNKNGNSDVNIIVTGKIADEKISLNAKTFLILKKELCKNCSRISGGYFEAVVQLRFEKKPDKKVLKELLQLLNDLGKEQELVKIIELKNGFDVQVFSKKIALSASKKIALKYKSDITKSFTVAGADREGKTKKRFTYCIRI